MHVSAVQRNNGPRDILLCFDGHSEDGALHWAQSHRAWRAQTCSVFKENIINILSLLLLMCWFQRRRNTMTTTAAGWCGVPHRAPGSSPPLVGLVVRKVVPGTGVRRGRERTGLGGAGRALGHSAVLLRGRTIVRVALAGIHLLVAEVDAQNLAGRLPLAARHRALRPERPGSVSNR